MGLFDKKAPEAEKAQEAQDPRLKAPQGPATADPIKFGPTKALESDEQGKKFDPKRNDPAGAADLRTAVMDVVNKEFAARGLQVPAELDNIVSAVAHNAAQGHYKVAVDTNYDPVGRPLPDKPPKPEPSHRRHPDPGT